MCHADRVWSIKPTKAGRNIPMDISGVKCVCVSSGRHLDQRTVQIWTMVSSNSTVDTLNVSSPLIWQHILTSPLPLLMIPLLGQSQQWRAEKLWPPNCPSRTAPSMQFRAILLLLYHWLAVYELNIMTIAITEARGKWSLPCESPEERQQLEANRPNHTLE